jgi:predicted enzyme related to lactoylglutathione lyase
MRIHRVDLILPSADPQQSLRFYVDGLLFTKVSEHPTAGLWTVALGDFQISFVRAEDASLIVRPKSRYFLFSVWVDGIQDYYDRVCTTGLVQIENGLDYYPGNTWQFSIIDNSGFRIGFNQMDLSPNS